MQAEAVKLEEVKVVEIRKQESKNEIKSEATADPITDLTQFSVVGPLGSMRKK